MITRDRAAARVARTDPAPLALLRDRVIDFRRVPASQLQPNPRNFRVHGEQQRARFRALVGDLGFAGAVLARQLSDGRLQAIDGHMRAEEMGDHPIPVLVTDLDAAEADTLLAAYDAVGQLAEVNQSKARDLAHLVAQRNTEVAQLLQAVSAQNATSELLERLTIHRQTQAPGVQPGVQPGNDDDGGEDDAGAAPYGERRQSAAIDDLPMDLEKLEDPDGAGEWGDDTSEDEVDNGAVGETADESDKAPALFTTEQVLDTALAHFRATGFPYRVAAPHVAMQQINKLARMPLDDLPRALMASDLADAYHPHRFHATIPGHLSPAQAFEDDALLRHALEMRLKYIGWLPDSYPTTLNIVHHTQAASNFRPGFAAYLYRRFGPVGQANTVTLDTSTGYGGRLIGWLASGLAQRGGRYIGIDPNTLTHAGNLRMARDLQVSGQVELRNLPAEDVDPATLQDATTGAGICDFAFTSPPYFAREHYSDEATQSWKRYPTGDAWREGFLRPMLRLQFAALKAGALSVINIDDVEIANVTYPLAAWLVEDAQATGFELLERLDFAMHTRLGAGHSADAPNIEPVFVLRKPSQSPDTFSVAAQPFEAAPCGAVESPSKPLIAAASAMTLERWMARLYALSVDESALHGNLGVWPVELGEYLTRLCRAYTPLNAAPAHLTLRAGLLLPSSPGASVPSTDPTPDLPPDPTSDPTFALLFSGGKDSIATGLLAQRAGYHVHALYVAKANYSYPHEAQAAERIAELLGWRFTRVTPARLPRTRGESVVKNQYLLALALEALDTSPARIACGNYRIEDCHTTSWFSDMEPAFTAFDEALRVACPATQCVTLLEDELHALRIWDEYAPDAVKLLTASCILPARNKPQHRRRSLEQGIPLVSAYDCGVCEKCKSRAVLLADRIGTELAYPPLYLAKARKSLAQAYSGLLWCHAHPSLEVVASADLPQSGAWVVERMYNGTLGVAPRINTLPAVEPVVTYA